MAHTTSFQQIVKLRDVFLGIGVGPRQLIAIAGKASGKGAKIGGMSAFLMAKEGR